MSCYAHCCGNIRKVPVKLTVLLLRDINQQGNCWESVSEVLPIITRWGKCRNIALFHLAGGISSIEECIINDEV